MVINLIIIQFSTAQEQTVIQPDIDQTGRFYVYIGPEKNEDNFIYTIPSLWMNGDLISENKVFDSEGSKSGLCIQFGAELDDSPKWCGVAWSFAPSGEAENWGDNPYIPVLDLSGSLKLVVRAKGLEGNEVLKFKLGIINQDDHDYGDSLSKPIESKWTQLKTDWKDIEIEIPDDADMSRIYTPFVWVSEAIQPADDNSISFLIGDIYYVFPPNRIPTPDTSIKDFELYE
jgi:hypothetical protein